LNLRSRAASPAALLLCTSVLMLSGCGIGKSTEDRINAAFPVGADIVAAKASVDAYAKAQSMDAKSVDDGYDAHMNARAHECAHGYQPSLFAGAASIQDDLTDKDCFAKADAKLQDWIARKRIGMLLASRPLRPLPDVSPSIILAGANITQADFAERAGVMLVQEPGKYEVIDIGKGLTIAHGDIDYSAARALSPNGRLFVVKKGSDVEIRESETGAVLLALPRIEAVDFHWFDDIGAILKPGWIPDQEDGRQEGPVFFDFVSATQTSIPMVSSPVNEVIPLPGNRMHVAILAAYKIGDVELTRSKTGWDAKVLSELKLPQPATWAGGTSGFTADGRVYFNASGSLELLAIPSLAMQSVTLDPMRLKSAVATADPDRLLLSGMFDSAPGQGTEYCLYSLSARTLAKVDQKRLLSDRIIYIPSLHKNAVIEDSKIVILDSIPAAAPIPINDYLEQRELAVDTLEKAAAAARGTPAPSGPNQSGPNQSTLAPPIPVTVPSGMAPPTPVTIPPNAPGERKQ